MTEEWRPIKHPEGLYEVSNMGRIRSLRFINGKTNRLRTVPLVRKPVRQNTGYLCVLLSDGPYRKIRSVHTLVLEAFVGPRPEGYEAAHLDGNPENPELTNLKWVTHIENQSHRIQHGTHCRGERNHRTRISEATAREILKLKAQGVRQKDICERFGLAKHFVQECGRRCWLWLKESA